MTRFDVDYPHVRQNANIVAVLAHYDVELKGDGEQRKGLCPFHEDSKPSLNVNVTKNLFKCHSCGSGGNVIKLVQLLDPGFANPRRAAMRIAELSGIGARPDVHEKPKPVETVAAETKPEGVTEPKTTDVEDGEPYNRPLTFILKLAPVVEGQDTTANQFVEARGILYERLDELGIGISERGSMQGRLAIPIHNKDNELIAYCGRDVGLLEGDDEPKYKLPAKFNKELELYGWNTAQNFERVVIVESFLTVIKHGGAAAEAGFGIASIMGTCISTEQVALLAESGGHVIVCFDGDEAGSLGAPVVAGQIADAGLWVTVCNYRDGMKPHQDTSEAFCERFGVN